MKRVLAIAKGRVQSVGYRNVVYYAAMEYDITGQVKNQIPQHLGAVKQ